jgi:hypothetical protein
MTKTGETSKKTVKKGSRSDRLAAALRENLRRRKAQVRGRDAASDPSERDEPKSS